MLSALYHSCLARAAWLVVLAWMLAVPPAVNATLAPAPAERGLSNLPPVAHGGATTPSPRTTYAAPGTQSNHTGGHVSAVPSAALSQCDLEAITALIWHYDHGAAPSLAAVLQFNQRPRYTYNPTTAACATLPVFAELGVTVHVVIYHYPCAQDRPWPVIQSLSGTAIQINQLAARCWLSRDPIEEAGGLNLYGYVLNDPVNMLDPLGLAGLNLFPPKDPIYPIAAALPSIIKGALTVAGHGSTLGMQGLDLEKLAEKIRTATDYKPGMPVVLMGCNVGSGTQPKELSDLLKAPVIASDQYVWWDWANIQHTKSVATTGTGYYDARNKTWVRTSYETKGNAD